MTTKTYSVPIYWSLSTVAKIKADTVDEAASLAQDMNLHELLQDAEYTPGSYESLRIDRHNIEEQLTYTYDCFGESLNFAESLGWIDNHPDETSKEFEDTPSMTDDIEDEALEFIKSKGYVIKYPDEQCDNTQTEETKNDTRVN